MTDARGVRLRLKDMLEASEAILELAAADGLADHRARAAIMYHFVVLGEAANHVPAEVQAMATDVAWSAVTGLRNRIAHGYFAIDDDELARIIRDDLPATRDRLQRLNDAMG